MYEVGVIGSSGEIRVVKDFVYNFWFEVDIFSGAYLCGIMGGL